MNPSNLIKHTKGTLLFLSDKAAVESLILKQEPIGLTGVRNRISDEFLDNSSISLEKLQPYFTKYAWEAVKKRGMMMSVFGDIALHVAIISTYSGRFETGLELQPMHPADN